MSCPGCGLAVSESFTFCPHCGQRQPWTCPTCAAACKAEFAFCPGCGTAREARAARAASPAPEQAEPPPPREADRRQVTVVFADVSGFTSLSEGLDPEEVRLFLNALFKLLVEVVERYDGFVDKFIGDEIMAVFGAPIAHENDPERALGAALDMVTACETLSRNWHRRLGRPVGLHIGVHTGPVVAGSVGAASGAAYTVTGDTVNTTARLLAAASGAILVSQTTHGLTRHGFAFGTPLPLSLKGKAQPVIAYPLAGRLAQPEPARAHGLDGLVAPLIGRGDELDQLQAAFGRMRRSRAQLVNLIGEAGTGKTRLVSEFLARLEAGGELADTAIRRASCSSLGEPAYGVLAAIFRAGYQLERDDSLETARLKLSEGLRELGADADTVENIAPVLNHLLGLEEGGLPDVEPEHLRRRILLATRTLVGHRLRQGPLLIIVDDYHWADSASADLLRDLADTLSDEALMVILAHRPDARPPLAQRAAQTIIRLAPLSVGDARQFVGDLFGSVAGEEFAKVQDFVAMRSGGNPLFVEEIARSLVNGAVLVRTEAGWSCPSSSLPTDVPLTLQGLLLSRFDRLAAEARRLLQEAAVLGAEFGKSHLVAIATDRQAAERLLADLVDGDFVRPVADGGDGGRYRFMHALMHESVYQNLLLSRRTELHERAGQALERMVGTNPERLSDLDALAHHWSLSTDKRRGGRYLLAAGDRARSVYANEDASRYYERALKTLDDCADGVEERLQARERLADLLLLTGRRGEALDHYEAVRGVRLADGDDVGVARLYRKLGQIHWEAGARDHASECFSLGLDRLDGKGRSIERARLFHEVGRLAFRAGDNDGAIGWARRAIEGTDGEDLGGADRAQAREAATTRVHAYNTLGVAMARMGRLEEAVSQIQESTQLAETHDLLQAACRGYANLGVLYSALDPRLSIETCLRGLETAKKVGDLSLQSRIYANLAVSYCALTDHCEVQGAEAARKAIDLDRRLGLFDHLAVPLIVLAQIHQCRGEHDLAFLSYEEALTLAERSGEPQLLFPCYDGLATLYLDAGNQASAELYLEKSLEVCTRAGLDPDAFMVLPFLD